MHNKIQYLVAAGLIALTASGTMQLQAEVQDTTPDSGYTANVDGEASASWSDTDSYTDANGSNDVAGGPTITATKTKFLLNKDESFNLLESLGLKVVDETDGDITSKVQNIDIPTNATASINKKLTVTNSKGVSSELPIQINIIDVPASINVASEADLENFDWGTEIGATPAITINADDLAEGKVEITVTDQVNTENYTVAVNIGEDVDGDTPTDDGTDENGDTPTDDGTDENGDTPTDDGTTDTDIPTDEDGTNDTDTPTDEDGTDDTDTPTDEDGTDDEITLGDENGETGGTGETTLESTKTGAVAIGQIGVGLSGLLALAVRRFRK